MPFELAGTIMGSELGSDAERGELGAAKPSCVADEEVVMVRGECKSPMVGSVRPLSTRVNEETRGDCTNTNKMRAQPKHSNEWKRNQIQ
jgi:hypothetical protein